MPPNSRSALSGLQALLIAGAALLVAACGDSGRPLAGGPGGSSGAGSSSGGTMPRSECAELRTVAGSSDLVPGILARGQVGDFVLENPQLRAIIQKAGRNWFNIGEYGGTLIDLVPRLPDGSFAAPDALEEVVLGVNIESTPNYRTLEVVSAGGKGADGTCQPAVLRATGPDDLFAIVNASSAVRQLGLFYPPTADDVDVPVTIQTDYILDATSSAVRMESTFINETTTQQRIYLVEYVNVSGNADLFQSGYGFGDAFVTAPCTACTYMAWQGKKDTSQLSYALVHNQATTSTVSFAGVSVAAYGRDFLNIATVPEPLIASNPLAQANFVVPASGRLTFTRHFAVAPGAVSSVLAVKNELLGIATGTLQGRVMDAAGAVAGAQITVVNTASDFPAGRGPSVNVVNQLVTTADGSFSGKLPAGSYQLRLNGENRLAGTPSTVNVTIAAGTTVTQNFTLPRPAQFRVRVRDANGAPIAAKVQLIGNAGSPDSNEPLNSESVAGGVLTVRSGVFIDPFSDPLPPGIAAVHFAVQDAGLGAVTVGDTGVVAAEPGSYQLSVSHGLRYNEVSQPVTLTEGENPTIDVVLTEVVATPGHIFGDFHVHSFESLDSDIGNRDRVRGYLAENMDFFTPSDHDIRTDFAPTVRAMAADGLIATAPAAEITTLDYGHFIGWPVKLLTNSPASDNPGFGESTDPKLGRGSVDFGIVAAPGMAFPSRGNFQKTPRQIIDRLATEPLQDGRAVVRQINHIYSHFGATGLQIDTGVNPPRSAAAPASKRLNPAWVDDATGAGNYYSDAYDTLELWINADGKPSLNLFLNEDLGDWYNLLNQGRRKTGMANSDTHSLRLTAQITRNLIPMAAPFINASSQRPVISALFADPHGVADAVLAGRNTMTNGPFVTAKLRNAANELAGLEPSDPFGLLTNPLRLASTAEAASLSIRIAAPEWAEYDQVQVVVNGHAVRQTNQVGQATTPPRYNPCPGTLFTLGSNLTRNRVVVGNAARFESALDVSVTNPSRDYWLVVRVQGRDGVSKPIWPVDGGSFVDGGDGLATRSVADRGITAVAVTNPIYVDADGDGLWTPPGVQTHNGSAVDGCPGSSPVPIPPAPRPAGLRAAAFALPAMPTAQELPLMLQYAPSKVESLHPSPWRSGKLTLNPAAHLHQHGGAGHDH